ncbi:hypothetical protein HD806DRAFT_523208 [Xylariaceae sp. AK1471]|nr:hypothetical protein HD806DRAFT_523208 [Xylariaceae sp. AK1471]
MRVSTFLAIAYASLGLALVPPSDSSSTLITKRNCYGDGEWWDNTTEIAITCAKDACDEQLANRFYLKGQSRTACYNLDEERNVKFWIKLHDWPKRILGSVECVEHLSKEIRGCDHGGKTRTKHWTFKADPNSGECPKKAGSVEDRPLTTDKSGVYSWF